MNKILMVLLALVAWPLAAGAALNLPGGTVWYLHADLEAMRDSAAGRDLYRWLDAEVFEEIRAESGIDVGKEVQKLTAYSGLDSGVAIVLQGPISKATRDKLMAIMALRAGYDLRDHKGSEYLLAGEEPVAVSRPGISIDFEESAFVSFAIPQKIIVTSHEPQMHALLERKGQIVGGGKHNGALLVLTADKTFVQAGMKTEAFADEDNSSWNSSILRNTEEVALMIAEQRGLLAIEAQLKSRDPRMTQSLGSVINGLISLQAFNDDIPDELRNALSSTKVDSKGGVLNVSTVLDPADLIRLMSD
ncbi:MAG: hypothetical protein WBN34_09845 [Woeseia sp.]